MKIPKILILLMSCNDKVFLDEEILCKNTWLKFVDNFDNINYYIYKAGKLDQIIHHDIFVKAPDDKDHTYTKTIRCFELINNRNIEYDYIVRTNLSTFINIPLLNLTLNAVLIPIPVRTVVSLKVEVSREKLLPFVIV